MQTQLSVIILAAGKGTRMKSSLPKVLHTISEKPLITYVLDNSWALNPDRLLVVVGYKAEEVRDACNDSRIIFIEQKKQLGTGHAVLQTQTSLEDFSGDILILCGDMPLVRQKTLKNLLDQHRETSSVCTLLILKGGENKDFGRIVRDTSGNISEIVEYKEATDAQKTIDEYNAGVYCFDRKMLFQAIGQLDSNNAQAEFYLTDTIRYYVRNRFQVQSVLTRDSSEVFGINSEEDLRRAESIVGR